MEFLFKLESVLKERKEKLPEKSYTANLFRDGEDRILKKITEEAGEVLLASKNHDRQEIVHESADLLFHLMVNLVNEGVSLNDIVRELEKRHG
ncbi:MAG: phosphoribosyl-ATP diphosphatase [Leptospiraceae bacterium]|nr:phosphoribosyl-ATP diphosphatase [Leptospiraceae bacterium]